MVRLMRWVVAVVMGAAVAAPGLGQIGGTPMTFGPPLEPALVQAIKDYDTAQMKGDRKELERLVAKDYLIVRPKGVGGRDGLIHNVAGEGIKTDPYTIVNPFLRNYGTTVVAGGWCDLHGTDHAKPWRERMRFADVWSKRDGRWYVVMTTLTPSDTP